MSSRVQRLMALRYLPWLVLAVFAVALPLDRGHALDKIIEVPSEDREMIAARAKAREALPQFWQSFANPQPGESDFALKVGIPYGKEGASEHFWLVDIKRNGDSLSGVINNDPHYATQVRLGQRYEFRDAEISDWLFMRNGKMVGNETMRPLLNRMPKDEADKYRAMYETP